MHRTTRAAVLMFLSVLLVGCAGQTGDSSFGELGQAGTVSERAIPPQDSETSAVTRRLIKTVSLDLRVDDPSAAADTLQKLASDSGGHVSSMTVNRLDDRLLYQITLRVPEAMLDETLARIKKLAVRIDRESLVTEDVTERYVDFNARLRTLEATETELRALLSESRQRQQKAEDIMAIYRELTEIRSKIEQLRGQLNVLEDLTSLARIDVSLSSTESPITVISGWRPFETIRSSFQYLASVLTGMANFAITFTIVIIPPVLILGLVALLALRVWRRVRRA